MFLCSHNVRDSLPTWRGIRNRKWRHNFLTCGREDVATRPIRGQDDEGNKALNSDSAFLMAVQIQGRHRPNQ